MKSESGKLFLLFGVVPTLFAIFFSCLVPSSISAETLHDYKVKAALIYKFMLFTQWPEDTFSESYVMVLGVVGHNPFGDIFDEVTELRVKGRRLVIRYLSSDPTQETLCKCNAVFISRTVGRRASEVIQRVSACPVLTISDLDDFLDQGGMIVFSLEHRRIRFSINIRKARDVGIAFSAQMLQLAKKVIDRDYIVNHKE